MLYLVTGANGTGKTLLTLKHVKELADREARPVCYNGRFRLNEDGPLSNWKRIDIKDWQAEPDGTIFFVDECHNDFPIRPSSQSVPEYVRMLAEHRVRGFDFFLITQHPQNMDMFVRRLIGNPGWHRHLKRVAGAQLVSQLQWDAVNPQCEKPGSGNSGQVTMVPYPKEVYAWYQSASIHTAKRKIPRAAWLLLACALLVPLLGWFAFRTVYGNVTKRVDPAAAIAPGSASAAPGGPGQAEPVRPMTAAEYAAAQTPRFPGLAWTAPRYDQVTQAVTAPYPAACLEGKRAESRVKDCTCYSQQGTRITTPEDVCRQIVKDGFFVDWRQESAGAPGGSQKSLPSPAASADAPRSVASASGLVVFKGDGVGTVGREWLASPLGADTAPVFAPGNGSSGMVDALSPGQARDAAAFAAMRNGRRAW
jgi:zona occludens toxin